MNQNELDKITQHRPNLSSDAKDVDVLKKQLAELMEFAMWLNEYEFADGLTTARLRAALRVVSILGGK